MKTGIRQVLIGFLVAILSGLIIFGAITLSLSERGKKAALPTLTQEMESAPTQTPPSVQPVDDTASPFPTKTPPPPKATRTTAQSGQEIQSTPVDQGEQSGVKPTLISGNHNHEYRSFLPLAHNAQQGTSMVIVQETPVQITTITESPKVTAQAGGKKSKTYCIPPPGWAVYIVRPGDTITRLSQITGISVFRLRKINCMGANKKLRVGKPFFIPIAPVRLPIQPPFLRFFLPPREPRSPESTQPIVIVTMPPEAPTAAIPLISKLPLKIKASGSRLDSSPTHLQRLFYAVI